MLASALIPRQFALWGGSQVLMDFNCLQAVVVPNPCKYQEPTVAADFKGTSMTESLFSLRRIWWIPRGAELHFFVFKFLGTDKTVRYTFTFQFPHGSITVLHKLRTPPIKGCYVDLMTLQKSFFATESVWDISVTSTAMPMLCLKEIPWPSV